jgi:protein phosphatase
VVLVLLLAVLGGVWAFVRTQWYVAESDGRVALYHGLRARPLGIPLSSVEQTYFPLDCLQPVDQTRIRSGYVADGHADAVRFIDTLRTLPSSSDTGPRVPPDARAPRPAPTTGIISTPNCPAASGP